MGCPAAIACGNMGDMAITTKRKRSGRKAPSAKKGSYFERTIVHPPPG